MLRLLTNIPIPVHGFLLVLVVILRLPVFHGQYFLAEESQYMLLAKQIAGNNHLYVDAWYAGPPVMVWIYSFFYFVFGANALFALRIFTCIYIYFTAVFFNGMVTENKPFRQYPGLPSVLFVLMVCLPWYAQQLSSTLFILLPVTLAFFAFNQVGEDRRNNYGLMFISGAWMMFCILTTYKATFILGGMLVAYIFLKKPQADEFLSLFGGMAAVLGGIFLILFFNQSLAAFWDIGVVYYLDRIGKMDPNIYHYESGFAFLSWIFTWGVLMIMAMIGFFHFRLRFYSYITKIRTLEITMAVWLVGVSLSLIFKFSRLELSDFILVVPPMTFYATKITDFRVGYRFRLILLLLILAIPVYQYFNYYGLVWEKTPEVFRPAQDNRLMHGGLEKILKGTDPLLVYFRDKKINTSIWIMDFRPEIMMAGNLPFKGKYTDFRIAWYKFAVFDPQSPKKLLSRNEPERLIFQDFDAHLPDYIADPKNYFPNLQVRFPGLFTNYEKEIVGNYTIYKLISP
ncbi:MAG: hypothetical protein SF052_02125 [Bacteroidia bacterium]|nr:hypothetical protein [Bacteroidia bacterium]